MSIVQTISIATDRVMAALEAGLELEFRRGAGRALAARFLEAEDIDVHWDACDVESWLDDYVAQDEAPGLISRRRH